jgi:hypothetical protein
MKTSRHLFLIVLLILSFFKAEKAIAFHDAGADIKWRALGGHRYDFTIRFYRDCRGVGMPPSRNLSFECISGASGSPVSINLPRQSMRNITPSCIGFTSPCNPPNTTGTGIGIEEHAYSVIVDFNAGSLKALRDLGCCRFRISFSECCRSVELTTVLSQLFHIDSEIDLCNIDSSSLPGRDNSPEFLSPPTAITCCNQPYNF